MGDFWQFSNMCQECVSEAFEVTTKKKAEVLFCSLLELNKIFPRSTICPVAKVNFLCCT